MGNGLFLVTARFGDDMERRHFAANLLHADFSCSQGLFYDERCKSTSSFSLVTAGSSLPCEMQGISNIHTLTEKSLIIVYS